MDKINKYVHEKCWENQPENTFGRIFVPVNTTSLQCRFNDTASYVAASKNEQLKITWEKSSPELDRLLQILKKCSYE